MSDIPSDSNSRQEDVPAFPTSWNPLDPLPEYTRCWGPHLRRPTRIPDEYDNRIDPAHIFVFSRHPITGIQKDTYVTPKPCDYCAKIRQVCSRSRPFCQRCAVAADPERTCNVEDGWVRLPGPKCKKLKLRVSRNAADDESSPSVSNTSPSRKARVIAPTFHEDPGPSQRISEPFPYSPQAEPPSKRARLAQTEGLNATGSLGVSPPRSVATNVKLSSAVEKKRRVSRTAAAPKTRRASRRVVAVKQEHPRELTRNITSHYQCVIFRIAGSWQAPDNTVWRVTRPPHVRPTSGVADLSSDAIHVEAKWKPPEKPRIWASVSDPPCLTRERALIPPNRPSLSYSQFFQSYPRH